MKIYTYGNPVLRKKSKKVRNIDKETLQIVKDMFDTMEQTTPKGIGLAAIQVGVPIAIFIYKLEDDSGAIINPEIIERSGQELGEEGCLSVPGIYAPIERAEKILVKGIDLKGRRFETELLGIKARVFQHEIDHLNGIIFTDYINELEVLSVEEGYEVPEELIDKLVK